jgi:hypothetical protein
MNLNVVYILIVLIISIICHSLTNDCINQGLLIFIKSTSFCHPIVISWTINVIKLIIDSDCSSNSDSIIFIKSNAYVIQLVSINTILHHYLLNYLYFFFFSPPIAKPIKHVFPVFMLDHVSLLYKSFCSFILFAFLFDHSGTSVVYVILYLFHFLNDYIISFNHIIPYPYVWYPLKILFYLYSIIFLHPSSIDWFITCFSQIVIVILLSFVRII